MADQLDDSAEIPDPVLDEPLSAPDIEVPAADPADLPDDAGVTDFGEGGTRGSSGLSVYESIQLQIAKAQLGISHQGLKNAQRSLSIAERAVDISGDALKISHSSHRLAKHAYGLQIVTLVFAAVTVCISIISLIWWWTQHYMLYKRNHIQHRHHAREEALKSRYNSTSRSTANGTGTDMREPSITFQRPRFRRNSHDLQMELETIIDEVMARPGRLPVDFTIQDMMAALEFQPEMAQPA